MIGFNDRFGSSPIHRSTYFVHMDRMKMEDK